MPSPNDYLTQVARGSRFSLRLATTALSAACSHVQLTRVHRGEANGEMLGALVTVLLLVGGARSYSLKQPVQWLRDLQSKFGADVNTPCLRYSANVLHSGVFNFAPWVELHHVVMLGSKAKDSTGVLAIDFSPLDQTKPETILALLSGKSVPAEIRVRWVPKEKKGNLEALKRTWSCMGPASDDQFAEVNTFLQSSADNQAEDYLFCVALIERVQRKWSTRMNLYHHNCQHFSHFVLNLVTKDEVCAIEFEEQSLPMAF